MTTRSYFSDRTITDESQGFSIVKPAHLEPIVPLACPVCKCLLTTSDDEAAWHHFECCDWCANTWAYPRQSEWNEGYRPTSNDVKRALDERLPLIVHVALD